jgi:hypothetical protein
MKKEERIAKIGDTVKALVDCELGEFEEGDTATVVRHGDYAGTVYVFLDKWEDEQPLHSGLACMVYNDRRESYEYEVIVKGADRYDI